MASVQYILSSDIAAPDAVVVVVVAAALVAVVVVHFQYVDRTHHIPERLQQRAVSVAGALHKDADPGSLAQMYCEVPWSHSSGQRNIYP